MANVHSSRWTNREYVFLGREVKVLRHESPLGTFVPFVVSPFERAREARGHATALKKSHRHPRSPTLRGNLIQDKRFGRHLPRTILLFRMKLLWQEEKHMPFITWAPFNLAAPTERYGFISPCRRFPVTHIRRALGLSNHGVCLHDSTRALSPRKHEA